MFKLFKLLEKSKLAAFTHNLVVIQMPNKVIKRFINPYHY